MQALAIGLLLFAATEKVGVRIEDAQGVSPEDARALARDFARVLGAMTGSEVAVDDRFDEECKRPDRCADEIRARTGASEIVFLKAYGAATRLRVFADRAGADGLLLHSVQADLGQQRESWGASLGGFAQILYPNAVRTSSASMSSVLGAAPPPAKRHTLAWIGFGGAAILGAVGVVFRVNSDSEADKAQSAATKPEHDLHASKSNDAELISALFLGGGAALLTGALVSLFDL